MEADMERFGFRRISRNDPLMEEVYKLRYKVYVEEWGFEKPEDHPKGVEIDPYDPHSFHLIAVDNKSDEVIGTMRVILTSPLGFPIQHHCTLTADCSGFDEQRLGEISRLAVSKEYRRRAGDRLIYDNGESAAAPVDKAMQERRKNEFAIITGLYTCMYKESLAIGLQHWYAVMAKGLSILLSRMGVTFTPIGPEVDYHGKRTPYIGAIDEIAKKVSVENARFFDSYHQSANI